MIVPLHSVHRLRPLGYEGNSRDHRQSQPVKPKKTQSYTEHRLGLNCSDSPTVFGHDSDTSLDFFEDIGAS
jgi:hypothetical protein